MNIISPRLDRIALALACETLQIEKLCDQDFKFLSEFVSVIKPIANAITYLEGNVQTFGAYLPMLFSVRQTLKDLYTKDDLEFCGALVTAVKDGFDKRFGHIMKLSDTFEVGDPKALPLFIAMISNPEFKINFIPDYWFHGNVEGMQQIKSIMLNAMKHHLMADQATTKIEPITQTNSSESEQGIYHNNEYIFKIERNFLLLFCIVATQTLFHIFHTHTHIFFLYIVY